MICNTSQVKSLGLAALVAGSVALPASAQSVALSKSTNSNPSHVTLTVTYTPAPGETVNGRVRLVPMLALDDEVMVQGKVTQEIANNAAALNQLIFQEFLVDDLDAASIRAQLMAQGALLTPSTPSEGMPIKSAVLLDYLSLFGAGPATGAGSSPFEQIKNDVLELPPSPNASGDYVLDWAPDGGSWGLGGIDWSSAQVANSNEIDLDDLARLLAAQTAGTLATTALARQDSKIEDLIKKHLEDLANLVIRVFAIVVSEDSGSWEFVASEPLDLDVILPGDGGLSSAEQQVAMYRLPATTGAWFYPSMEGHYFDVELAQVSPGVYPSFNGGYFEGVFTDITATQFDFTYAEYFDVDSTNGVIRVHQPQNVEFGDFSIRWYSAVGATPIVLELAQAEEEPSTPLTVAQYLKVPSWWVIWPF
ncbi:MAG: hypothetical protein AAF196_13555 [Planctomycetota bacterium]